MPVPRSAADVRAAWRADLDRYPPRPWLREQSIWAIAVHRLGSWNDLRPSGSHGKVLLGRLYWPLFRLVSTLTGIELPKEVALGPGLRIHHFGTLIVHPGVTIGDRCTLRHGVTLGERSVDGPLPVLGDDVEVGAGATVLGGVRVGDGVRIGAMALVVHDVAAGQTVVAPTAVPLEHRP